MTTETQAQFARRLGCNKSRITRLKQAGRLVLAEDGGVEVEASLERIEATRGGRYDVEERFAEERGAPLRTETQTRDACADTAADLDALDLDAIGKRTRVAQMLEREAIARIKSREEQEQAGQLLRRAAVVKAATDAIAILLNAGEALPDRATPLLLGCNDAARIRAVLRDEIEQLFQIASDQLGNLAGRRLQPGLTERTAPQERAA